MLSATPTPSSPQGRLAAENERLRQLLESITDGLVVVDRSWRLRYVSERAARIVGLEREQLLGADLWELFPRARGTRFWDGFHLAMETGHVVHFVDYYPEPLELWLECHCHPSGDELTVSLRDVSDARRAEEALHQEKELARRRAAELQVANARLRELDRRKDEFLGMLSHELRNPLAPIRNSIFVLRRGTATAEQVARAHRVLERQTEHLTRLVDDLLDVTRIARGRIALRCERVDLAGLVSRAAEDFRTVMRERDLAFEVQLPSAPVEADADPTRVTQVVGNLLHNAAKFSRSGDRVTLALAEVEGMAELRVRDTGAGIEPALLDQIFEPFVQGERTLARTEGGLGLGLALVKMIAELHGGSVRAESQGKGHGAELIVRLPLAAARGV
jgi:signal transduction histidine kinase